MIARQVVVEGEDAERVASAIVDELRAPDLRCAFVFADWRLDSNVMGKLTHRALAPALVIGGTTVGVIGTRLTRGMAAVGLGFYGDALRFGLGIASDVPKSPLVKSRDAVQAAAAALGTTVDKLDARHVGVMLIDGKCGAEEACCIGSAAAAPQIRFVGGSVAADVASPRSPYVWAQGEVLTEAAVVILIETSLPFVAVQSAHLVPTDIKTVVTAAVGRDISELDGYPAASRLAEIVEQLGGTLDARPQYSFARYIDGTPYVRSIRYVHGENLHLASAVEVGQVLRVMRPGDLIGQTTKDLTAAAERIGGMSAFLAFSCIGRHYEAAARGIEAELGRAYAAYPTVGFQSLGEQAGMLLCNHTLTGLAIGKSR
ncbi:MAG: FIST C-terminal domain-containing protein [Deltaproteobacteria bacterium]|nr:FIST C-terminal domain-containing protein [Deltaproteobacteria bacterium]